MAANLVVTSRDTWYVMVLASKKGVSWCCGNIFFYVILSGYFSNVSIMSFGETPIITHLKSQATLSKIWESCHFIWRHKSSAALYPILFTSSSKINRRLSFACFLFENIVYYSLGRPRDLREIQDNGSKKMAGSDWVSHDFMMTNFSPSITGYFWV